MPEQDAKARQPTQIQVAASATNKSRIKPSKMAMATSAEERSKWMVEVDVCLESDTEPPKFRVESFLQAEPNGKLVFHNRGRPGFDIVFHLRDETGRGYRFPKSEKDAVWSQLGAKACPKSEMWQVFKPLRVFNDGMSLTVFNRNPYPAQGEFTYTLRVTNGDKWRNLDPGGTNQNGQEE